MHVRDLSVFGLRLLNDGSVGFPARAKTKGEAASLRFGASSPSACVQMDR